jgi:hypothetical protein
MHDVSDKNRFATAWTFCDEGIKDENHRKEMYKTIIECFLKSPIVTDRNKNNLLTRVQKLKDKSFEKEYADKIKKKQTYKR